MSLKSTFIHFTILMRSQLIVNSYFAAFERCQGRVEELGTSVAIPCFSAELLRHLCKESIKLSQDQPSMLSIPNNVVVVGDLHGNLHNLCKIFTQYGTPPHTTYLFLGNFIDFGEYSLEVAELLLALSVTMPHYVFLLRGINESFSLEVYCGFNSDINNSYSDSDLVSCFRDAFSYLPSSALIAGKVFCCQPPVLKRCSKIREAVMEKRPIEILGGESGYDHYLEMTQQMSDELVSRFVKNTGVDCIVSGDVSGDTYISSFAGGLGVCISSSDGTEIGCVLPIKVGQEVDLWTFETVPNLPRKQASFQFINEDFPKNTIRSTVAKKKLIVPKAISHENLSNRSISDQKLATSKIFGIKSEGKMKDFLPKIQNIS